MTDTAEPTAPPTQPPGQQPPPRPIIPSTQTADGTPVLICECGCLLLKSRAHKHFNDCKHYTKPKPTSLPA